MSSKPLITVTEIKEYVKTSTTAAFDSRYFSYAEVSTGLLEKFTGRKFEYGEYTSYFSPYTNARGELNSALQTSSIIQANVLTVKPISVDDTADIKIYYDESRRFDEATLVNDSFYEIEDAATGKLRYWFPVESSKNSIKVVCYGGIAPGDNATPETYLTLSKNAPADLKLACLVQVLFMINHITEKQNIGVREQRSGVDGGIITAFSRFGILCPESAEIIKNYRVPVVLG